MRGVGDMKRKRLVGIGFAVVVGTYLAFRLTAAGTGLFL